LEHHAKTSSGDRLMDEDAYNISKVRFCKIIQQKIRNEEETRGL
jgi:hypothetical protein